jgi:hypothetical protein
MIHLRVTILGPRSRYEWLRKLQGLQPLAHTIVGGESKYTVRAGDSSVSLGARNGMESATLAALNGLKPKAPLKPGQTLKIDNRHLVPADPNDRILVNLPERELCLLNKGIVC